ncbi:hypothetical protein H5410_030403 [Solanum commersonii]|uniref:Uncharacterized protein n=1 Tax=Solanum commersonii TaxID=4109 RepID=A0A9J5YFK5_SOLCO|nr:hypothetical protein H5410_030403 [Solanum commersonii]
MTTKLFPIKYIKELEGGDSSIDLLSALPKASGMYSSMKDNERNTSMKRKHVKRDQEWEYILETERRPKVDKELKLHNLRDRACGATSFLFLSEVGLIIGVHVLIKSETLISIPSAVEVTSEVSLSVPRSLAPLLIFQDLQEPLHCI